jgi:hypothetical protein
MCFHFKEHFVNADSEMAAACSTSLNKIGNIGWRNKEQVTRKGRHKERDTQKLSIYMLNIYIKHIYSV